MARRFLGVAGEVLLSIGGIGIIAGLVWLTESMLHGTLLQILDERAEGLLYLFPALLFLISIVGAALMARALSPSAERERKRNSHRQAHIHV